MIEVLEIESEALKGFPVQDATRRKLPVFVPTGAKGPLPVVFLLSGWGGRSSTYLEDSSAFGRSLEERLNQKIEKGEMPPAIVAFPDGTTRWGSSQYVNSAALGRYSDFICDECVTFIDSKFETHRSADFRALAGHSSGGFGALINGILRPDRFRTVYASAADTFFDFSIIGTLGTTLIEIQRSGSVEAFLKDFFAHPHPDAQSFDKKLALMTLNMAACYTPNPSKPPLYADLFFDPKTGVIEKSIWDRMKAWDPIHMVQKHSDSAKKLKKVFLEAGLNDQYGAQFGHRQFAEQLNNLKIPYEIEEISAGHTGNSWRFADRIQKIVRSMNQ